MAGLTEQGAQRWPSKNSEWLAGHSKELIYDCSHGFGSTIAVCTMHIEKSSEIAGNELRMSEWT
jgi:hypothetical protein